MVRQIVSASMSLALLACAPSSGDVSEAAFDAASATTVSVDDLVLAFRSNEVAANDEWSAKSAILSGYVTSIIEGDPPRLEIKGVSGNDIRAEVPERSQVAAIETGETVDLECVGVSSLAQITAHECRVAYHGKRREKDPYWPDPVAIKDPL